MEIFAYHEGLGKWTEIGNSGMFRPEMLRPMGLPENVSGTFSQPILYKISKKTEKNFKTKKNQKNFKKKIQKNFKKKIQTKKFQKKIQKNCETKKSKKN